MENQEILINFDDENEEINIENDDDYELNLSQSEIIYKTLNDYEKLNNKPQINSIELIGNKTAKDLKLQEEGDYPEEKITNIELEHIFNDW